jgi:O-antigen ligase
MLNSQDSIATPKAVFFENRYPLNASDLSIFAILVAMILLRGIGELLFTLYSVIGMVFVAFQRYRSRGYSWFPQQERNVLLPVVVAMWVYFWLKAASVLWSNNPMSGLRDLGTHLYFLMFPFAYVWLARAKQARFVAHWGVVTALCGAGIWALRFLWQGHLPSDRFIANTGNALVLGLLLNFYVLALLCAAFSTRFSNTQSPQQVQRFTLNPSVFVALCATTIALYANNSRAAWLNIAALLLFGVMASAWNKGRIRPFKLALTVLCVAAVLWFAAQFQLKQGLLQAWNEWRAASAGVQEASSLGLRYTMYQGAWQAFLQSPWFGVGAGSVQGVVAPLTSHPNIIAAFSHVHNQFLQVMVELGLLGLAVYASFLGMLLRTAKQAWRVDQTRNAALLIAGLVVLAVLNGLSNIVFKQGLQAAGFMTLLAVACKLVANAQTEADHNRLRHV